MCNQVSGTVIAIPFVLDSVAKDGILLAGGVVEKGYIFGQTR